MYLRGTSFSEEFKVDAQSEKFVMGESLLLHLAVNVHLSQ
jgi:hypothetical protein